MKAVVALLLLLCLCLHRGHSDCQADCLSCGNILPKQLGFNTMVCLAECQGNVSPTSYRDLCRKALSYSLSGRPTVWKRSQEEVEALYPEEEEEEERLDGGLLLPVALQRFDHVMGALRVSEGDLLDARDSHVNAAYDSQNALSLEDDYEDEAGPEKRGDGREADAGPGVSKRFGGFVKGRHGYRRLMYPGRSYQKRYGGFIGIRKSARKWNNQKRFSEFLKQYLGMSARATEFAEDLTRQRDV